MVKNLSEASWPDLMLSSFTIHAIVDLMGLKRAILQFYEFTGIFRLKSYIYLSKM